MTGQPILVSIHDVMPESLTRVKALIETMTDHDLPPALLLVCPGKEWNDEELATLKSFEAQGHRLAGHGWRHRTSSYGGIYHRIHSALISRNVAEHLEYGSDDIAALIAQGHSWFGTHGFRSPSLYVPPAWAMGSIPAERLRQLPYRWYETLTGVYDAEQNRRHILPLLGFEADTPFRGLALRCSNTINSWLGQRRRTPVRVALHPYDLEYCLSSDIEVLFDAEPLCLTWDDFERQYGD